jgi:hypothetical protein
MFDLFSDVVDWNDRNVFEEKKVVRGDRVVGISDEAYLVNIGPEHLSDVIIFYEIHFIGE